MYIHIYAYAAKDKIEVNSAEGEDLIEQAECICMFVCMYVCMYIYMYMCVCVCVCVCVYIYIYTYIHICSER
jgi:hypothetical protein